MKSKILKNIIKAPKTIIILGAFLVSAQVFSKKEKPHTHPQTPTENKGPLQRHSIGLGIGQTFLHGKYADSGDDKITWDLFYNYSASHSFDFIANFHTSSHELDDLKTSLMGLSLGIKAKAFRFDKFAPYILAGLGFYKPKLTRKINNELVESKSKLVFGTHLGAGAELELNDKVTIGLLGQYHNPFDINQSDQPEVTGSYFKLMLTSFYKF